MCNCGIKLDGLLKDCIGQIVTGEGEKKIVTVTGGQRH